MRADLRVPCTGGLPDGLEVIGGEGNFEEQEEDGASAFLVPEGAYVKVCLPAMPPFQLEDDGRLHRYSVLMAMRMDRLPTGAMPLFNGSAPPAHGEVIDSCMLYKNGGVGMLGQMGAADAALRPGRWAWVVVTRSNNQVCTYVNGRLCAKVDVSVTQPTGAKDGDGDAQVAAGSRGKGEGIEGEMGDGEGSKTKEGKAKAKRLPERLCLDPTHLALFATPESTSPNPGDDGERGLSLRYVQVSTDCWDAAEVRRQLDSLRSKDEEAALTEEVDATRFWQLSLQPLYAKPPPVWMHPAFAAEFGDAFIGGTGLESGSMQVSLEVVVLAVEQMVRATGTAARMLSHADRSALNSILAALGEAKRLAHKLAHASSSDQQRLYLSRVVASLEAQQPGEVLPIPFLVGGSATFLVVRRGVGAGSDVCTLAVVGCQAEDNVYGHRCEAVPPKIKYETCLELRGVKRTRLLDEALWVVIWFAGH